MAVMKTIVGTVVSQDLNDNFSALNSDLIAYQAERVNYTVGTNQKFATINDAYNQWVADGKPLAIIDIRQGTYNEYINAGALVNNNNLMFRGENKETTTWKYGNGTYDYAPFTGGGNFHFKNLTIIANHDDNPAFVDDGSGGAYAVHLDFPGAEGTMILENCILKSYQDSALGSGTRTNQEINVIDCELYSYAIAGAGANRGALLYHTAPEAGHTNQTFKMKNVYAYSVNGPGMQILSSAENTGIADLECINCIARSDYYETFTGDTFEQRLVFQNDNGLIHLSENSQFNNSDKINYLPPQRIKLTEKDGTCQVVDDFDDALIGYFTNRDSSTLNTPIAGVNFIGRSVTYSTTGFTIQEAYAIQFGFIKFERTRLADGSWTDWIKKSGLAGTTTERLSESATNIEVGAAYYDTTLHKPIWCDLVSGGTITWLDTIGNFVTPPTGSSSPGHKGDFSADTSYIYVCINTNTWIRSATTAW